MHIYFRTSIVLQSQTRHCGTGRGGNSLWLLEVINSVADQNSNLNPRLYSLAVSALHLPHPHVQSNRFKLLKNVLQPLQKQFNGIHRHVRFSACMFFSWTQSFVRGAFSSANVALVFSQSTSSRWKQQQPEGILFTPTLFPYSLLHTDATGLCKVSFHTPQSGEDGNRDIRHERALSLSAALVRRLLSRRGVVLWPFVWSDTHHLHFLQNALHMSHSRRDK